MEIAREQKPGVGKEREKKSYWKHFNRKLTTATQPVILLLSHPNHTLRSLQTLSGINEAKCTHWKWNQSDPAPSALCREHTWSCSYTKVKLTDTHLSDTESATVGHDTLSWETCSSLQHSQQHCHRD